jgi:hypothetical protein
MHDQKSNIIGIFIKWIAIPLGILLIGFIFTLINFVVNEPNLTVLSTKHTENVFISPINQPLTKNTPIKGEFRAKEPYLGIVTINFDNSQPVLDTVLFRIKEKGSKKFFHEATYEAMQFYSLPMYPFGIPVTAESKGKIYEFEIKVLKDNKKTQLRLNSQNPNIITQYQFTKSHFTQNPQDLWRFLYQKMLFTLETTNVWKSIIIYLLPLIFYLVWNIWLKNYLSAPIKKKIYNQISPFQHPFSILLLGVIFIYVLVFPKTIEYPIFFLAVIWLISDASIGIRSKNTYSVAFIFLIFVPLLIISEMNSHAERAALISYLFLFLGSIQLLQETYADTFSRIGRIPIFKPLFLFVHVIFTIINRTIRVITIVITHGLNRLKEKFNLFLAKIIKKSPETPKDFAIVIFKLFISSLILITILLVISTSIILITREINHRFTRMAINPKVKSVSPKYVYPANKIIIRGTNFGWKQNGKIRLMTDSGEVTTDLWTDTKIILTVPLHWKAGDRPLWIEKETLWEDRIITVKSSTKVIKLLEISNGLNEDYDAYIKQFENLDDEVLKLNGYDPKNNK